MLRSSLRRWLFDGVVDREWVIVGFMGGAWLSNLGMDIAASMRKSTNGWPAATLEQTNLEEVAGEAFSECCTGSEA